MRRLAWHGRCILALISTYILGRRPILACIGFVSRHVLRRPIVSVFLLYPARKEYADALAYRWHRRRFSWHPGLVGLYRQGARYGMIFGIPDFEDEVRTSAGPEQLSDLMANLEALRSCVGAERKVFAGILPSTFLRHGIENQHLAEQRTLTARAVLSALEQVIRVQKFGPDVPILVLGGRGYIASEVLRLCDRRGVISIDVGEPQEFENFVSRHHGSPAIIINLTKSGALAEYTGKLWPGVIVLNEVYPEPTAAEIAELDDRGARCYHIVGVPGRAWPPFPNAYKGGIPCCAALPFSKEDAIPTLVARLGRDGSHSLL